MTVFATFFSYKGGAGRSTTCLNTLPLLANVCTASKNAPILILDTDIESAGMTYLLGMQNEFRGKFDVKELVKNESNWPQNVVGSGIVDHPLYANFRPVGKRLGLDCDEAVMFLGVDDGAPIDRMKIDGAREVVINRFRNFCQNNRIRAVITDSAAGDQFSARLSVELADKLVFCMRPTIQFRVGTFSYLRRMDNRLGAVGDDKDVILLPTVVPKDAEIDGVKQLESSAKDVDERLAGIKNVNVLKDFVSQDMFGINEVARFKWQEGILYDIAQRHPLNDDEQEALERYEKLARLIME